MVVVGWLNQINQQLAGKTSYMLVKQELLPATCWFCCWLLFRLLVGWFIDQLVSG